MRLGAKFISLNGRIAAALLEFHAGKDNCHTYFSLSLALFLVFLLTILADQIHLLSSYSLLLAVALLLSVSSGTKRNAVATLLQPQCTES